MANNKVLLSELCDTIKGKIGIQKATPGKYPMVVTAEERLSHNDFHFDSKAVIVPLVSSTGHGHASIKRIHYQEGKFALGSILAAITVKDEEVLDPYFLYIYLSYFKDQLLVPLMKGSANVSLNIKKIGTVEIVLPSIIRQREIIELEKNDQNVKKFELEIKSQKSLLSQLKQSILQEAIQGELTAEWRAKREAAGIETEPASELLKRIKAEKARLIKEKKIKKEKPLTPISEEEKPFGLPEGWEWCRLGEVLLFSDSGKSPNCEKRPALSNEWGVLTTTAIQKGIFREEANKVLPMKFKIDNTQKVEQNDVLITRAGPLNRTGVACKVESISRQLILSDKTIRLKHPSGLISPDFLVTGINSQTIRELLIPKMTGMAESQVNISQNNIKNIAFMVPPLKEQIAIVKKVESLMKKCSELETEINQSEQYAQQLMQAVLKEAFEG